jgi:hypothetical protein
MTQTTTIRISLIDLGTDRAHVPALCNAIEASLLKDTGAAASVSADSMTILIDVPTSHLIEAAATLRSLALI